MTPTQIVDQFKRFYRQVYGHDPQVTHMFAEWYQINGETVHRTTIFSEIGRLRTLAGQRSIQRTDRTLVQRLIARLRGI